MSHYTMAWPMISSRVRLLVCTEVVSIGEDTNPLPANVRDQS